MAASENRTSGLAPYQVDHLILLVGRNPLPNAVAGVLLTKPGGRISLIHSQGTAGIRDKLQNHLIGRGFPANTGGEVDAANSPSIINTMLKCLRTSDETVGLHYTGGTKAMSVHSFRALETWAMGHNKQPIFSYLEASTLQIRIDPNDPKGGGEQIRVHTGLLIDIQFEELVRLHDWELKTSPRKKPIAPRTAKELLNVFSTKRGSWDWIEWKNGFVDNRNKRNPLRNTWYGRTDELTLPESPTLTHAIHILLDEIGQAGRSPLNLDQAVRDKTFPDIKTFCEWMDGKWLEHSLLQTLKELAPSLHLHSCMQNIVPREVEFDLDVVAMRGYQLFAFSCSTEDGSGTGARARLKRRLFEVYVRATQLGGDEARVALICSSDDPSSLQDEMRRSFSDGGRIKVFGREHLANLTDEIKEWITSQEGIAT